MKVTTNERLIARNVKIGNWSSLVGLGMLGIGLYISLKLPEYIAFSFLSLLIGVILANIGLYNANRWAKRPRPEAAHDGPAHSIAGLLKCIMQYGATITKMAYEPRRYLRPCSMKPRKKNSTNTNPSP